MHLHEYNKLCLFTALSSSQNAYRRRKKRYHSFPSDVQTCLQNSQSSSSNRCYDPIYMTMLQVITLKEEEEDEEPADEAPAALPALAAIVKKISAPLTRKVASSNTRKRPAEAMPPPFLSAAPITRARKRLALLASYPAPPAAPTPPKAPAQARSSTSAPNKRERERAALSHSGRNLHRVRAGHE